MTGFRDKLRELRKERGMTQQAVAEALGVSFSTVSMYERGQRCPDMEMLGRIADYFGVTTDVLLGKSAAEMAAPAPTSAETMRQRLAARYGLTPAQLATFFPDGDTPGGEWSLADPDGGQESPFLQPLTPPPLRVTLTPRELEVLAAYRARPEVRPFVDKLLDLPEDETE